MKSEPPGAREILIFLEKVGRAPDNSLNLIANAPNFDGHARTVDGHGGGVPVNSVTVTDSGDTVGPYSSSVDGHARTVTVNSVTVNGHG